VLSRYTWSVREVRLVKTSCSVRFTINVSKWKRNFSTLITHRDDTVGSAFGQVCFGREPSERIHMKKKRKKNDKKICMCRGYRLRVLSRGHLTRVHYGAFFRAYHDIVCESVLLTFSRSDMSRRRSATVYRPGGCDNGFRVRRVFPADSIRFAGVRERRPQKTTWTVYFRGPRTRLTDAIKWSTRSRSENVSTRACPLTTS